MLGVKSAPQRLTMSLLRQGGAVEIRDFNVAEHVDLNNEKIVFDVLGDLGDDKDLFMHLLAVDTAALFHEDHEALALRIRFFKVFAKILERISHPRRLMQAIVTNFCGG